MTTKIKWNKQFEYPESIRSLINNERHYDIGESKLPSVTTILQATLPEEKKASLAQWKQRVGADNAEVIKNTAANRGSIMHRILEGYLLGQRHADLSDLGQEAGIMAQTIIDEGLEGSMDEVWGTEITLYYPGLYAGACDLAGIYNKKDNLHFHRSYCIFYPCRIYDYYRQKSYVGRGRESYNRYKCMDH